jgi:hypothetical protein
MSIKKYFGDSLWFDITVEGYLEVDSVWANWSAQWAILDSGGVTVASGTMSTVTAGVFYARITPAVMATVTVATYTLVVQVNNPTAEYSQELHDKLVILTKGI